MTRSVAPGGGHAAAAPVVRPVRAATEPAQDIAREDGVVAPGVVAPQTEPLQVPGVGITERGRHDGARLREDDDAPLTVSQRHRLRPSAAGPPGSHTRGVASTWSFARSESFRSGMEPAGPTASGDRISAPSASRRKGSRRYTRSGGATMLSMRREPGASSRVSRVLYIK